MPSVAKKTDWKIERMPAETEILDFQRTFSSQEFERIRLGLIPREMEDKWFIYLDNDILNIHRSWTGYLMYEITLKYQEDGTYRVIQAVVNRNTAQYNQQNNEYDISLVNYLIDRLLLGKNVPFPLPTELSVEAKAIYKHSIVGHATPNSINFIPDTNTKVDVGHRLQGCLVGGAIGDAVGSYYEGRANIRSVEFDVLNGITDDTQLTLATCEAILDSRHVSAESIAKKMLERKCSFEEPKQFLRIINHKQRNIKQSIVLF